MERESLLSSVKKTLHQSRRWWTDRFGKKNGVNLDGSSAKLVEKYFQKNKARRRIFKESDGTAIFVLKPNPAAIQVGSIEITVEDFDIFECDRVSITVTSEGRVERSKISFKYFTRSTGSSKSGHVSPDSRHRVAHFEFPITDITGDIFLEVRQHHSHGNATYRGTCRFARTHAIRLSCLVIMLEIKIIVIIRGCCDSSLLGTKCYSNGLR